MIDEYMLLSLEIGEFFTVNYSSTCGPSSSSAAALRDRDVFMLSENGNNGIQSGFNPSLGAQTFGWFNSQTQK